MKTIVVGAGGGGIASALLARSRGEEVLLLESHSAFGGCASWFRRGEFIYDAGATTLSGVGIHGPVGQLFELLGHAPRLHSCDPGIVFHLSSGKVIRYHKNFEQWLDELHFHFPLMNHRPFWELIRKIDESGWSVLKDVSTFPFQSSGDIFKTLKHLKYLNLVPYLLISTEQVLKKFGLDQKDYLELVNGILLISAQATSEHIPFLVGAMALSYPRETYAPFGGMKGLMAFFESELNQRGVKIRKKSKVAKFSSTSVTLSNGEKIDGDRFILNLPIWNLAEMSEGMIKKQLVPESQSHPGAWGAFTLYFGVKSQLNELYHQVHLNHPKVKNYFVSFSIPNDLSRAPLDFQSVSISTHVYAEDEIDKKELAKIILDDFTRRFHKTELFHLTTGSPKTFERYTGRKNGFVGGLPFLYGKNPMSMLGPLTKEKTIFRVGDTIFPGQGLCGVVAGAWVLHRRLINKI